VRSDAIRRIVLLRTFGIHKFEVALATGNSAK
jgi:hypothetical protein